LVRPSDCIVMLVDRDCIHHPCLRHHHGFNLFSGCVLIYNF
jgi:hypothetical protein